MVSEQKKNNEERGNSIKDFDNLIKKINEKTCIDTNELEKHIKQEIIKIASEQLGLEPTTRSPLEINDADPNKGMEPARKQLEGTLESREREWASRFEDLEKDRNQWKDTVQAEQAKNSRLIDQVVRKDQDIHRMLQRKVCCFILRI